jgi:hypothetical protein
MGIGNSEQGNSEQGNRGDRYNKIVEHKNDRSAEFNFEPEQIVEGILIFKQ